MNTYLYWILAALTVYLQIVLLYSQYGFFIMTDTKPDVVWFYAVVAGMLILGAKELWPMTRKHRTRMNVIVTSVLSIAYLLRVYFDVWPTLKGE